MTYSIFMESSYVARIYGDSLRDNFVGYTPLDAVQFDALRQNFEEELALPEPYLARLLTIEAALIELMPDDVVSARFWAIDDRFRRVVPLGTRDRYDASVSPRGSSCWSDNLFLRNQTRTLLDVIHANYLINIGREKSIKRLKTIMFAAMSAVLLCSFLIGIISNRSVVTGLLLLACAGVCGAFLSILNRMQNAVSLDAMAQDGLYELTGLRVGWVGILTSFVMGGGFALVLYTIVMAGAFSLAFPTINADVDNRVSAPPTQKTAGVLPENKPIVGPASPVNKQASGQDDAKLMEPRVLCGASQPPGRCRDLGAELAAALGLDGVVSLFRMLMLAFLAGFAERLVPDILNRLSKQGSKQA